MPGAPSPSRGASEDRARRAGRNAGPSRAAWQGDESDDRGRSKRQLHPRRQLETAGELAHLLGNMALDALLGVIESGEDEVFQHLDLVGVGERFVDLDLAHIALAGQRDLHQAAAGGAGHLHLIETRLHLGHLGLHLLRLLHHLAEILHRKSSPSLRSSALSGGSASAAGSGAPSSRTASMRAPGKVSSTARTNGCCAASFRSERARTSACSRKVGAPSSPDMLTTQRVPVHSPSSLPSRLARSRGAPIAGRNSMRPGSRCTCAWRWVRSTASRYLSNSSITSRKLCGCGSAGAGSLSSRTARRGAALDPPSPDRPSRGPPLAPTGAGVAAAGLVRGAATLAEGPARPLLSCFTRSAGAGRSAT